MSHNNVNHTFVQVTLNRKKIIFECLYFPSESQPNLYLIVSRKSTALMLDVLEITIIRIQIGLMTSIVLVYGIITANSSSS